MRLADCGVPVHVMHGNFADMRKIAIAAGIAAVDGILLDLGVSSPQLDEPARGFSFRTDGPLDMRMDQQNGSSAADLVNGLPEEELARIFYEFGEERASRRVARAIVARRKTGRIEGTLEFAGLVERALGGRHGKIHPATRVFQALRIAVNGELDCLARGLESGLAMLKPGGRMAVISFHSLEDRIVKRGFLSHVPATNKEALIPHVRKLTKKPVTPSDEECAQNPRARSAKLRVVEVI
jgi:16S rRNA (cytosine1402-N4)-methyltransferase